MVTTHRKTAWLAPASKGVVLLLLVHHPGSGHALCICPGSRTPCDMLGLKFSRPVNPQARDRTGTFNLSGGSPWSARKWAGRST